MSESNHTLVMLMISFFKHELSKTHNQWDYALDHFEYARDNTSDMQTEEARSVMIDAWLEFNQVDDTLSALCTILKN